MQTDIVAELLAQVVEPLQLEIDRIETAAAGKRTVLRVFIDGDGPSGSGPSLDDIAGATRAISKALDESPATGSAPYVLEVSSRGVSRPLTEPKHYRRNKGRLVAFKMTDETSFDGRIVAVDDAVVRVDVEGAEREVVYADVAKAVVQVELNRMPATSEEEE